MGQNNSTSNINPEVNSEGNKDDNSKDFIYRVEEIVKNYISKSSFKDLTKTTDLEYCDKLILLTADALKYNLNNREIEILNKRTKDGKQSVNDEKILFGTTDTIEKFSVKNSETRNEMCIGIAKFYIKIYHLFAAVVTSLNPVYEVNGKKISVLKYDDIDKDSRSDIIPIFAGFCQSRIDALINNNNYNVDENTIISIKPQVCSINTKTNNTGVTVVKNLTDEPGFPELESLYMDVYNDITKKYDKMSKNMKKQYIKDVKTLYKLFSGNDVVPETITKFSQIPLKDYHDSNTCTNNSGNKKQMNFNNEYIGNLKQKLFQDYVDLISSLEKETKNKQTNLLKVLDKIFISVKNKDTTKKQIIIDPELTTKKLDEQIEAARKIIIQLYVTCEEKFVKGIDIFISIIEKTLRDKNYSAIKELENIIHEPDVETEIETNNVSITAPETYTENIDRSQQMQNNTPQQMQGYSPQQMQGYSPQYSPNMGRYNYGNDNSYPHYKKN